LRQYSWSCRSVQPWCTGGRAADGSVHQHRDARQGLLRYLHVAPCVPATRSALSRSARTPRSLSQGPASLRGSNCLIQKGYLKVVTPNHQATALRATGEPGATCSRQRPQCWRLQCPKAKTQCTIHRVTATRSTVEWKAPVAAQSMAVFTNFAMLARICSGTRMSPLCASPSKCPFTVGPNSTVMVTSAKC
jgi:hypothetical protein